MANDMRVKNTVFNFLSGMVGQLITIFMHFMVRTVFIQTLGKSYLGISGLFTNILSMLSLAEMGIGSAIVFKLYEPIAANNQQRIATLMKFYKTVYRFIGFAIAILGAFLIPFLPKLINDYDKLQALNLNVTLIFSLYLFDAISSYLFFAYKSALIRADQKEYHINIIEYFFLLAAGLGQILCLLLFENFITFVIITIAKTVLQNLLVAKFADKKYPCLKNPVSDKIDRHEAKEIFRDCGSLFIYKINGVVIKSTDNIVLSAVLGLGYVAIYSNYYIFYSSITSLFNKIFNSVAHSIGNLHTTRNLKKEYNVFESTILIAAVIGGTAFVGISIVANEFISTWIGNEWLIAQPFALLMGLELYTSAFKYAFSKYRAAYGLFRQGWIRPLFSMIINLVVSIILVKPLGIIGVLIGTLAADWLTFIWYDPLIVHRDGFKGEFSVCRYYFKFIKYLLTCFAVCAIDYLICMNFLAGYGWASVILHALICGITTPLAVLLVSAGTEEGKYVISIIAKEIRAIGKLVKARR